MKRKKTYSTVHHGKVMTALVLPLLLTQLMSCKTTEPPIPLYGRSDEVQALVGEWRGTYESMDANRHGSIYFKLDAKADSAIGHIVMKMGNWDEEYFDDIRSNLHDRSELLTIRFVSFGMGRVVGRLDEYKDPVCGCPLETTFEGHVNGDRIEGVFVSHGKGYHLDTTGNWWVERISRGEKQES